jgi:HPt (histidine-containing phosphotransfer) domain-containing protein
MNDSNTPMTLLLDPVDLEVLYSLAEAQGDEEPDLIVELIDLYLVDTPLRLAAMQEALASSDELLMGRGAHALKGSSSTLGAAQVAESCAELELLARATSFQEYATVLARLEQEFISVQTIFLIERQKRV